MRSPAKLAAQERFRAQTLAAHGLYVARVQPIAEFDHYIITDVWRHDPALGPAPEIGSEWQPGQAPMRKRRSGVDAVLINVTARERGQSRAISHIAQGVIVGPNLAIDELRAAVVASQPTHPVPARMYPQPPDLDETIARADAIYLTHVDTSDGYIRYRIREVWRHRATEPAPAVGAEYLPHPPRKAPPHYGDIHSAVITMYPRPKDGRRSVGSQQVPVINGHLWGSVSLFDLRQRVKKADEHRVPETATISAVQP